jgi:hypothetical protein
VPLRGGRSRGVGVQLAAFSCACYHCHIESTVVLPAAAGQLILPIGSQGLFALARLPPSGVALHYSRQMSDHLCPAPAARLPAAPLVNGSTYLKNQIG